MPGNQPDYTDREFLEAVANLTDPVGTQDVAERVGCTRQAARLRLLDLQEQGKVSVEEIGNAYVWQAVER